MSVVLLVGSAENSLPGQPVQLDGPAATRLPERAADEADDISSESHSGAEGDAEEQGGNAMGNVAATSIAIDPVHTSRLCR